MQKCIYILSNTNCINHKGGYKDGFLPSRNMQLNNSNTYKARQTVPTGGIEEAQIKSLGLEV